MATKKRIENHTGFKDGNLHCFNCGESYNMNLPQPVKIAAFMMIEFGKTHKNCKKANEEQHQDKADICEI